MTRHPLVVVLLATLVAVPSTPAQEPQREQARQANASPAQPAERRSRFQMSNIRVELTVTDSMGGGTPQKKTVSMMIADGQMGRVRAMQGGPFEPTLNVDATPEIVNERVRLQVSLVYIAPMAGVTATRVASITENVTVILDPGKPLVISQSADPAAERKVTVEVTATILK
jgi:hypothetical protein